MKTYNRAIQVIGEDWIVGVSKTTVRVLEVDGNGNIWRCKGTTKPTDGNAGYAVGCEWTNNSGGSATTVYVNEGTAESCAFAAGVTGGGDITSVVAGAGLTGGATSGAATLNVANTDGKITVSADSVDITPNSLTQADITAAAAIAATADGLTTGVFPATAFFGVVTSANANYIVTLPASVVGKVIRFKVGANGCEVRTTAASSIKINDVVSGSTNEAAIPADTLVTCICVSATEWVLTALTKLGAVVTAIVPDAV